MRLSVIAASLGSYLLVGAAWAQPVDPSAHPPLPPGAPAPSPGAEVAATPSPGTDNATTPQRPPAAIDPAEERPVTGFSFGSYGRVGIASDLRGRTGRQANITAFGTRLDLAPYMEAQFNYDWRLRQTRWRAVLTLAANDSLFHFTGDFSGTFAIRNLYLEEQGALHPSLSLWAGSRMYRGDDAYLLNWWPLDNLNMVGGGARFDAGDTFTLQAAIGMNRLDDPYQLQTIAVTARDGFGGATALLLDRPRIITSAKVTWWLDGRTARSGMKLSLYGEYHVMAEGVRQINDRGDRVLMPSDSGYVVGAQFGAYSGANFINVFARWSQGLGAYGDLRVPAVLDSVRTSERAQELRLAAAGNWEHGMFALMGAAYVRYFRDADPGVFSRGALWEGAVVARPIVWFGQRAGLAVEGSYQRVVYNALDPETGVGAVQGSVFRAGVVPFVSPGGRGSFTRPHLQLTYLVTVRDEGARKLYAPGDPFGFNSVEHYLGIGAEWWFNSSYL